MDAARPASSGNALIRAVVLLIIFFSFGTACFAQDVSTLDVLVKIKQLVMEKRWSEVVQLVTAAPPSADLDYYYGLALANLERWEAAQDAFEAGEKLSPNDERFPLELAGIAFKQKNYKESVKYLRRALEINPKDDYANDFLATVYFLQENVDAALKYWNRTGKPYIATSRFDPSPKLDAVLLDHALACAPGQVLTLDDYRLTQARLKGLEVFSKLRLEVAARDDGKFDAIVHNDEQHGFGKNKWEALVRLFRNLPGQSIHPEYYNFKYEAINLISAYRWDAEKRRLSIKVSMPWLHEPKRRFTFGTQLRGENWDIRDSASGDVPVRGSMNMRREAVFAELRSFPSGRWGWSAGAEVSHRDYRDIFLGSALTPALLKKGYQLKQTTSAYVDLLRFPERRITVTGKLSSEAGRLWADTLEGFEKLQAGVATHWYPQATGDDYEVQQQFLGGKTWGDPPFDELFMFGGLGDNNLMMRGHITTHGGRKGSGPLGRNYFLSNWEMDKNVYRNGLLSVKVGPFLDTGKITDPSPRLVSQKWLWDTGGQMKVRALGIGVALTYGRDLRSGKDAFFITMLW